MHARYWSSSTKVTAAASCLQPRRRRHLNSGGEYPLTTLAAFFLRWFVLVLSTCVVLASLTGCEELEARPELFPDRWAPPAIDRPWSPPGSLTKQYGRTNADDDDASGLYPSGDRSRPWDLPGLIDLALRNNPQTRRAWEAARAAAANFGAAQAPYYPHVALETEGGYQRTMLELPSAVGTLKQWQMDPVAELNWTLLDFGRRRSIGNRSWN
jgi:outer membrane protein